jgi:hypothetical protein
MTKEVAIDPRDNESAITIAREWKSGYRIFHSPGNGFSQFAVAKLSPRLSIANLRRNRSLPRLVSARVREKNTTCESGQPNTWLRPSPQWGNSKYRSPDGSVRALWLWRPNYVHAFTLRTWSETIRSMWRFLLEKSCRAAFRPRRPAFRGHSGFANTNVMRYGWLGLRIISSAIYCVRHIE